MARSAREWARLLEHEDPSARAEAAYALRQFPARDAVEPLRAALTDLDAEVRGCAVDSIGALGREAGDLSHALIRTLADEDPSVAGKACAVLQGLGAREDALPDLLRLLVDSDVEVRQRATRVIAFVENAIEALTAEVDRQGGLVVPALQALASFGPDAASALPMLDRLAVADPAVRRAASRARSAIRPRAARPRRPGTCRHRGHVANEIFTQLDTQLRDWPDAPDGAIDLVFMMNQCDWESLAANIHDRSRTWRMACVTVLAEGPIEGHGMLERLREDPDPEVAAEAEAALRSLAEAGS